MNNPRYVLSFLAHDATARVLRETKREQGYGVVYTCPDGSIDVAVALEVEAAALLWSKNADAADVTITVTRKSERFIGFYETSIIPQKGE
jgi:hypothetical protein